jgi:hypothetical protein
VDTVRGQIRKGRLRAERVKGDYVIDNTEIDRYQRESLGRQGFASVHHPRTAAAMYRDEREVTLRLWQHIVDDLAPALEEQVRALSSPSFAEVIRAATPAQVRWIRFAIMRMSIESLGPTIGWLDTLERLRRGVVISPPVEQQIGPPPGPFRFSPTSERSIGPPPAADAPDPEPFRFGPPRRKRTAKPKPDVDQQEPVDAPLAAASAVQVADS